MGNETKINPFARILNAVTKVNPNLASQKEETASQTVVNSELAQAHEIEAQVQEGTVFEGVKNDYVKIQDLSILRGEKRPFPDGLRELLGRFDGGSHYGRRR